MVGTQYSMELQYWKKVESLYLHDQKGPSGVPFGGIGAGYFEWNPDGRMSRTCINNIHKEFVDFPEGTFLCLYEKQEGAEPVAVRLQKDDKTVHGMGGFSHSHYLGLFPVAQFYFDTPSNSRALQVQHKVTMYSGVIPHDSKNSSLPAAFYEVELSNPAKRELDVSIALSWADLIGRGIRDTVRFDEKDFNFAGDSADWCFMEPPETESKETTVYGWRGIHQFAKDPGQLFPSKMTLQNYNSDFMILAEQSQGVKVSCFNERLITDQAEWQRFARTGKFSGQTAEVENRGESPVKPVKSGAVAAFCHLKAGETKTVRFLVSWFMPEPNYEKIEAMPPKAFRKGLDYGRYYHNFFRNIRELSRYLIQKREEIFIRTIEWQLPLLDSSLPDWLKLKIINSGYTLFTNCVLTKRGCFSSLEGEMGGLGGTMDQKMCSHPFYQKLFPGLDTTENEQFSDNPSDGGQISHMDILYYDGINTVEPEKWHADRVWDGGSMVDNTGAWMVQMLKNYDQTGDISYIRKNYARMNAAMKFMENTCNQYAVPIFGTTYDDATHPPLFIFSATVYLLMLRVAAKMARLNDDTKMAEEYEARSRITEETIS